MSIEAAPHTVLITGASGFLSKHLLAALTHRFPSARQRVLVRQPTLQLEKRGVEMVLGDVCDPTTCAQAVAGVHQIYHAAGGVSRHPNDSGAMYRVHVEGTRVLLQAAHGAQVRRVVVVSTSGTMAVSLDPHEVSDETSPYRHTTVAAWPYYLAKIYQEQTALEMGRRLGLEVVVVNPSLLLGPGDDRLSSTGDVEKVVRGRMPIIPKGGGVAFVDARDAAEGCLLAMEKGRPLERYLLSGANMTLETLLGRVARLAGVPSPRPVVSPRSMQRAAKVVEMVWRRFDRTPPLEVASTQMAEHTWYVDTSKAVRELGFAPRSPQDTLVDTVRYIQKRRQFPGHTVTDGV